jgi:hypothetical protein
MKNPPVPTGRLVGPGAGVNNLEERKTVAPAYNRTPDQHVRNLALQRLPVLYFSQKQI